METDQKDQTPEPQETPQEPAQMDQGKPPRKVRRKRGFHLPKYPAAPVKSLWMAATPEEQQQAHKTAVLVLEHWMGRMSRQELAQKLQMPAVRAFQLSRMALSGMVAGLLKQPKPLPKGTPLLPQENPKLLLKRVAELERQNSILTDILQVVRDLPTTAEAMAPEKQAKTGKKNQYPQNRAKDPIPPRKPPQDNTPQAG